MRLTKSRSTVTSPFDLLNSEGYRARLTFDTSEAFNLLMNTTPPGACVSALAGAGAGNVDNGTHSYKVTFVTATGETDAGPVSNTTTVADETVNGKIALSSIPTSSFAGVTSRKIYRTAAGNAATGPWLLLTTIADNTTTTLTDNTADSGLGATAPTANTTMDARLQVNNVGDLGLGTAQDVVLSRISSGVLGLIHASIQPEFRAYTANSTTKYVTLKHDGTDAVIDSAFGQLKLGTATTHTTVLLDGHLQVNSDNTYSVGTATKSWARAFVGPGSVTAPSVALVNTSGTADTGWYSPALATVALTLGGVLKLTLNATAATFVPVILAPSGAEGAPAYSFSADATMGVHRPAASTIDLSFASASRVRFSVAGGAGTLQLCSSSSTFNSTLTMAAANVLSLQNSTTAQEFRVYGTTTGSKYVLLKHDGTDGTLDASSGKIKLGGTATELAVQDTVNISLATGTGTKIGTGTTQKLGIWNATPIAQPSSTGETNGFTGGAGTAVRDDSTFTGNVGSTAYRISDIVKHLKNIGLIAQ